MSVRISRDRLNYFVGPDIDPVAEVDDGATITFETIDCFSGKVRTSGDYFPSYAESLKILPGWNPITGPIFVKGARKGDCLRISILDIELPDKGVTSYVPKLGMLSSPFQLAKDLDPDTRICRIRENCVFLPTSKGEIAIPASPMIGTISVAPEHERIASFKFGAEHCGNVDCKEIGKGNEIILPVNVEGALFGLGDVHAVQGDGEISCVAVEISTEVTVSVNLISREEAQFVDSPQINGKDFLGSLGCHYGNSVSQNIKYAYFDLIHRLNRFYGFSTMDAYHLLSQVGEVRVCQVLGDFQAALAKIKKSLIE